MNNELGKGYYTDTDGKTYYVDSKGQVWLRSPILVRILALSYIVGWLMIIAGIALLFTDNIVSGMGNLIILIAGYGLMCCSCIILDERKLGLKLKE